MKRIVMMFVVAAILIVSAHGQTFQNLNFESAYNLTNNPGNGLLVSVSNALPGWNAYDNGALYSYIFYVSNSFPGASSAVELEGGSLALAGNWSVGLYLDGSISQTGMVPANAESLEFEAYIPGAAGFSVSMGGQSLSYTAISGGPDYTVYAANIPSDMDGQMEELTFGCQGEGNVLLDDIDFSSSPVPEPSEYALVCFGTIVFCFRALSKKR